MGWTEVMTIFSVIPLTAAHIFCITEDIQTERSTSREEGEGGREGGREGRRETMRNTGC